VKRVTANDVTGPASAALIRPDGEPPERLAGLPRPPDAPRPRSQPIGGLPRPPGALRLRSHLLDGLPRSLGRTPPLPGGPPESLDGLAPLPDAPPESPDRVPPLLDGPPGSLDALPQSLTELEFVIVDVETTGWLPEEAGITEIGAVRVSGGRIQAQFCTLVNPGRPVPADITALTGITDAMIGLAPPISVAMPRFLAFAGDCVLTAHNAAFDISFLSAACGAAGISWPAFPVLDTVALARLVLGAAEVPDRKLRTLASFFATKTLPCHRALPDAMATAEVLQALLRRLAVAGVRTLAELRAGENRAGENRAGENRAGENRAGPAGNGPPQNQAAREQGG
jgi:DNA polymerase III epsilon subunit family exonuclease